MAKQKKGKTQNNIGTDEIKRHMSVLMEHSDQQIKIIGEQYGSIIKKLDEHDGRFARLETAVMDNTRDIKQLQLQTRELQVGQEEIKQKLNTVADNHETRICRLEAKVGA